MTSLTFTVHGLLQLDVFCAEFLLGMSDWPAIRCLGYASAWRLLGWRVQFGDGVAGISRNGCFTVLYSVHENRMLKRRLKVGQQFLASAIAFASAGRFNKSTRLTFNSTDRRHWLRFGKRRLFVTITHDVVHIPMLPVHLCSGVQVRGLHPNEDERYRLFVWANVSATLYLLTDLPLHYATLDCASIIRTTKLSKMDRFLLHYSGPGFVRSVKGKLIFFVSRTPSWQVRRRILFGFWGDGYGKIATAINKRIKWCLFWDDKPFISKKEYSNRI